MSVIKRLNVNKFTSEGDNDAFIEKLKQIWLAWKIRQLQIRFKSILTKIAMIPPE
ncbi:MAG: hypothetical protein ACI8UP_004518 [Porticoccaceae bacterium]|jgi:hypothetical protein